MWARWSHYEVHTQARTNCHQHVQHWLIGILVHKQCCSEWSITDNDQAYHGVNATHLDQTLVILKVVLHHEEVSWLVEATSILARRHMCLAICHEQTSLLIMSGWLPRWLSNAVCATGRTVRPARPRALSGHSSRLPHQDIARSCKILQDPAIKHVKYINLQDYQSYKQYQMY